MRASLIFHRALSIFAVEIPLAAIPSWILLVVGSILSAILVSMLGLLVRAVLGLARAERRRDAEQAQYAKSLAEQNITLMQLVERLRPMTEDSQLLDRLRDDIQAAQASYQAQVQATQDILSGLSEALRQEVIVRQRRVDDERDLTQERKGTIEAERHLFQDLAASLRYQEAALNQLGGSIQASTAISQDTAQNAIATAHALREIAAQLAHISQQQQSLSMMVTPPANRPYGPWFGRDSRRGEDQFSPLPEPLSLASVRFTAYYSDMVPAETWNGLRVYTHLEEALEAVRTDAARSKEFLGERPTERGASARGEVRQGDEITIVPDMHGVEFAPHYVTFSWIREWQSADFNFRLPKEAEGTRRSGTMRVFANGIITAEIAISFDVQRQASNLAASGLMREPVEAPCRRFQRVFGSYSHKDGRVVLAYRDFCKARGDDFYLDIDTLKPGQRIDDTLKNLIEQADIFQLFWSKRAARSKNVRTEWIHALGLNRGEGFVLPVYWEKPFIPSPPELPEAWFKYVPLPKLSMRRWLVYMLFGYAG